MIKSYFSSIFLGFLSLIWPLAAAAAPLFGQVAGEGSCVSLLLDGRLAEIEARQKELAEEGVRLEFDQLLVSQAGERYQELLERRAELQAELDKKNLPINELKYSTEYQNLLAVTGLLHQYLSYFWSQRSGGDLSEVVPNEFYLLWVDFEPHKAEMRQHQALFSLVFGRLKELEATTQRIKEAQARKVHHYEYERTLLSHAEHFLRETEQALLLQHFSRDLLAPLTTQDGLNELDLQVLSSTAHFFDGQWKDLLVAIYKLKSFNLHLMSELSSAKDKPVWVRAFLAPFTQAPDHMVETGRRLQSFLQKVELTRVVILEELKAAETSKGQYISSHFRGIDWGKAEYASRYSGFEFGLKRASGK